MPFRKFLLITGFLILSTVGMIQLLALDSDLITPRQISTIYPPDDDIAGAAVVKMDSVASGEAVYVAWMEDSIADSLGQDFDVFYRELPNGVTTNLSTGFSNSYSALLAIVEGEENQACILWMEESYADNNDQSLVLWNSATNSKVISPQIDVYGSGFPLQGVPDFNCSATEPAQIVWANYDDVFLWDTGTNNIINLSNNEDVDLFHKLSRVDADGTIYLAWSYDSTISFWDSDSNTVEEITDQGWNFELHKDKDDVVYFFWQRFINSVVTATCWNYWDSDSDTTELFVPCGEELIWELQVDTDDEGDLHVIWANDNSQSAINYWNVAIDEMSTVTTNKIEDSERRVILVAGKDNTAHVFWQEDFTNDYYYWNSVDAQQVKMNDTEQEHSGSSKWLRWDIDSEGKIYAVWGTFEDSTHKTHYWSQDLPSLTTIYGQFSTFVIDENDVSHIVFHSFDGLKLWNSNDLTTQHITSNHVIDFGNKVKVDIVDGPFDELLIFFNTTTDSINYWNETEGESVLGEGDDRFYEYTESGKFYMYWDGEYGQVYAAWNEDEAALPPASDNKEIFLPFVKK